MKAAPASARPARASRRAWGQALAEFALALPVMLLLIFGILDFGRAIYALNTISNSSRTGARVAIVNQDPSTDCTVIPLSAKCAATDQAVGLGITTDDVDVSYSKANNDVCQPQKIGCTVAVTVHYEFIAATPIISEIVGTIDMASSTQLPLERKYP